MTDDEADSLIDAQLRNVIVPADLADRLRRMAQWPDEEVDRDLADIGVPVLLKGRLKSVADDADLDEQLRDVPQPAGLRARLRKIAASSQFWRNAGVRSLAASLLMTITLGYGAFAWQLLFGARHGGESPPTTFVVMRPAAVNLQAEQAEAELMIAAADQEASSESFSAQLISVSPLQQPLVGRHARSLTPVESVLSEAQAGKLHRSLTLPVLGAPIQDDLPQLVTIQLPQARGVATPLVPGYNRAFLRHTGVHPPILTGLNPALQRSLAPLSVATDSFDEISGLLAAKKRVPAERVRTEDFIAAVEHRLPAPGPGEVSLSAFGSVSPFGPEPTRMLGLGVRAGDASSRLRASTHLVLAVDFSAGLDRSGDWPWVREALVQSVARLGADDRVSLVFYQDDVLMASSPLERKDVTLLGQRLSGARPQGEVDPAIGLEAALDLALAAETPAATRRIAVLTDGHFELAAPHHKRLQLVAEQARRSGIDVDVIQLGSARSVAQGAEVVSRTMRAQQSNIDSRRQLVHGLLGLLHGDEGIASQEVKLVVRFPPEAVAAYRLIGHEANTMAQLTPPAQVVELRAGDEAVVLFELLPTGNPVETLAEVELSWLVPGSGERRSVQRRVSRSELFQPWEGTPPAFRAATIAAEAAEQLRGSRIALRELKWVRGENVELAELLRHARALRSSADTQTFEGLIALLEAAAALPEHQRRR
jgi:hypothetical protein